jgi:hypothetical protein
MIRYAMICSNGHEFEGWFGSSADFDTQQDRGLLSCPVCGAEEVDKAVMSPSIRASRSTENIPARPPQPAKGQSLAATTHFNRQIVDKIRELRNVVIANTEDVGNRFTEEARMIHYGETEARGIRGQADREQAQSLIEEGIDIMAIPELPEDRN